MLKRNKAIAIVMAFVFCMSFLAPGLVAPQVAKAAAIEYSAIGVPTVKTSNAYDKDLAQVLIEIDDPVYLGSDVNWVTMKMPSGVKLKGNSVSVDSVTSNVYDTNIVNYKNSSTVDIGVQAKTFDGEKAKIILNLNNIKVQSGSGNLDVMFVPQSGSALPGGTVTVANIVSKGATKAVVTSVKDIGDGLSEIDTISIGELSSGVFTGLDTDNSGVVEADEYAVIELELPDQVEWDISSAVVAGGWAFSSYNVGPILPSSIAELSVDSKNKEKLYLTIKQDLVADKAGRIDIGGAGHYLKIDVDDDAKMGEIKVDISSDDFDGVTEEDIVVAVYADYEASVSEKEVKEVVAGHTDQEIGSFYIEEAIAGSLIGSRTINFELPDGVKWTSAPEFTVEEGSIEYSIEEDCSASKVKAKITSKSEETAKILVENGEVYVEPGFEGDIEIEVSGSAGVEGTVKVAEAVKAVEITASEVPEVVIGEQGQTVGNIIIKENVKEAIFEGKDIVIEMDGGYKFYKEPTVKVTEGDLEIDDVDINNDDQLVISIDDESSEPSTIEISDIFLTGYRYAPAGPVVAKLVEAEGEDEDSATLTKSADEISGSTALDSFYVAPEDDGNEYAAYSEVSAGEVTIAKCITPAEAAGTSATFNINSNIYTVNGVTKVMDVAPYIKNARTYMPVRYVAYALGLSDDDIVWDAATQKVTLTKGDTVVEMTIGSTTITVNGEAQTTDVAPEITSGRTMLPARFVAEAFGFNVGWDPATQTVIITE